MHICNAGCGANDVILRIAGLVTDGTGRKYGDWRHVATGCNALVMLKNDGSTRQNNDRKLRKKTKNEEYLKTDSLRHFLFVITTG